MSYPMRRSGFTIIELLIVIVVIGILAAITIIAYTGIQQKARIAVLQSDLKGAVTTLELANADNNGTYPADLASAGLKNSPGTSYQYTGSGSSYCLTGTNSGVAYMVSSDAPTPTAGVCPGDTAPGGSGDNGFATLTWTHLINAGAYTWGSVTSSGDGVHLVAGVNDYTNGGYIYTSSDSGATWTQRIGGADMQWTVTASRDGSKLVAQDSYHSDVYTSSDYGATWTKQTIPWVSNIGVATISNDGTKLSMITNTGWQGPNEIYLSTDSGVTWVASNFTVPQEDNWYNIVGSADGTKLLATTTDYSTGGYLYTSTDSGVSWTQQTAMGKHGWYTMAISTDGTKLLVADDNNFSGTGGYIYTSTDSGATWTKRTSAGTAYWTVATSSDDGTKLSVANFGNGSSDPPSILTSTDSGATWTKRALPTPSRYMASSSDGTKILLAGTDQRLFLGTYQ